MIFLGNKLKKNMTLTKWFLLSSDTHWWRCASYSNSSILLCGPKFASIKLHLIQMTACAWRPRIVNLEKSFTGSPTKLKMTGLRPYILLNNSVSPLRRWSQNEFVSSKYLDCEAQPIFSTLKIISWNHGAFDRIRIGSTDDTMVLHCNRLFHGKTRDQQRLHWQNRTFLLHKSSWVQFCYFEIFFSDL